MIQGYYKLTYALAFLSSMGLLLIFLSTTPLTAGPAGMLVVFFLAYVLSVSVLFVALHTGIALVGRLVSRHRIVNAQRWRIGVRKSYYIASVLGFGPILLLAMQSVGQLQIRDIVLTITFLVIAIFYVIKRS